MDPEVEVDLADLEVEGVAEVQPAEGEVVTVAEAITWLEASMETKLHTQQEPVDGGNTVEGGVTELAEGAVWVDGTMELRVRVETEGVTAV